MTPDEIKFEADLSSAPATDLAADEPALVVDVEGFEGPLDLLLALARQQKVDLAKISILALADQYLSFIEEARKLRLELAADYLVMAAWLAYLKSRLLLPDTNAPEGQSAEDMATALALRLKRLEAIRDVAERLFGRAQLDRDVFRRGQPEPIAHVKHPQWTATLYDLLSAYAQQRQKTALSHVRLAKRTVWSLAEAREALERLIGRSDDWTRLDEYLITFVVEQSHVPTVFASSFASTLELVREGLMEVHQQAAFAPLYVRKRVQARKTGWRYRAAWRRRRTSRDRGGQSNAEANGGDASRVVDESENVPQAQEEMRAEELRLLEAMLFASAEPLDEKSLAARLPQGIDVHAALVSLQEEYAVRGVNLVRVNGKWNFRTASDLSWLLSKETIETRKLSRAAIETLAIIAYHQPVTRAEIEDIRGVSTSKGSVDVLLETGWIRPRGRRKAPGRPVTYGTNEAFLSHFGLDAVGDLPGLDELKGSGLLDGRLPPGFAVPMPSDDPALRDDEDPLEPGDLDLGAGAAAGARARGVSRRHVESQRSSAECQFARSLACQPQGEVNCGESPLRPAFPST